VGHARQLLVLCLACACEPSEVVGYGEIDPSVPPPAVYDTIELAFGVDHPPEQPFQDFLEFEFWNDSEHHNVDAYYDGDSVYRVRFMVTKAGTWQYRWGNHASQELVVQERRDLSIHGPVHVSKPPGVALWHDDGSVHYWFGGKSFTANNYGLFEKERQSNTTPPEALPYDTRYSNDQVGGYLDLMQTHGHTGTRLKVALYPLETDGFGWDTEWIRRAESWIKMMQERRIYCQITLFDAYSRRYDRWFEGSDDPREHVFNAWEAGDEEKKQNYIRTLVARFAGFWNVYWELVSDVDRAGPEAAEQFVAQSDQYLAWLDEYDPYDRAIGASESQTQSMKAAVAFPRTQERLADGDSLPALLWNEMVGDCSALGEAPKPGNDDATMRNPAFRYCYRSAIWRAFVSGAFGASTASWLDLNPTSANVLPVIHVMRDQQRLQSIVLTDLLNALHIPLSELVPDPAFVDDAPYVVGTRAKPGQVYVSYFNGGGEAASISVRLPAGNYSYRWLNPRHLADGEAEDHDNERPAADGEPTPIAVDSTPVSIDRPAYDDDLVLVVQPPDGIH